MRRKQILQWIITGCSCEQGACQGVGTILDQKCWKPRGLTLSPQLTEFITSSLNPSSYTFTNAYLSYLIGFLWMMKLFRPQQLCFLIFLSPTSRCFQLRQKPKGKTGVSTSPEKAPDRSSLLRDFLETGYLHRPLRKCRNASGNKWALLGSSCIP